MLVYYLFPVIPLFAAGLALAAKRERLERLTVPFAGVSVLVLAGALVGGMLFSDKMQGARTAFSPKENHYAYEFYQGRKSDAELAPHRAAWLERQRLRAARKAAEAAAGKAGRE